VTLQLWAYEGYKDFLGIVEPAFEKKYPNIDLQITNIPEEQYVTKVDTALAVNRPPDLGFIYDRRWLKAGKFEPLDDLVKANNIDLSTYTKGIVGGAVGDTASENAEDACTYEGKIYCLGSYTGVVMMFYNRKMFEQAGVSPPSPTEPMSIEQFREAACKLTNKDKKVWGAAVGDPVTWMPWEMIVGDDGKQAVGHVNSPQTINATAEVAKMMHDGCAPSLNVLDPWEQGRDFFSRKQLGMVVTDFQSVSKIEKAGIDWGVTMPPNPPGFTPFFNEWTDNIGVFKGGKNVDAAKKFIAFQTTEGQKLRVKELGDLPVDSKVADELNWAGDSKGRKEALEILNEARPNVAVPNRWEVVGPLFDSLGPIVNGDKSAADALNEAAPKIQRNLDAEWKKWEKTGQ
jgi:multiple sugar transport system substrate-binding protein